MKKTNCLQQDTVGLPNGDFTLAFALLDITLICDQTLIKFGITVCIGFFSI